MCYTVCGMVHIKEPLSINKNLLDNEDPSSLGTPVLQPVTAHM